MASNAALERLPFTPRSASCVASRPSTLTLTERMPASFTSDALGGDPAAPGGHRAVHAVGAHGAGDVRPVVAEVGLAADEGDLLRAELGHLPHEVEGLVGGELVGARRPAREPQWRHERSHRRVISHTA
jgi:hypothetical protein